jgi:hypothetical protein
VSDPPHDLVAATAVILAAADLVDEASTVVPAVLAAAGHAAAHVWSGPWTALLADVPLGDPRLHPDGRVTVAIDDPDDDDLVLRQYGDHWLIDVIQPDPIDPQTFSG